MLSRDVLGKLQNFPSQFQVPDIIAIRLVLFLLRFVLLRIIFRLDLLIDVVTNVNASDSFMLREVEVETFEGVVQDYRLNLAHLQESLAIQKKWFSTLHSILAVSLGKDGAHLGEIFHGCWNTEVSLHLLQELLSVLQV